MANWSGLLAAAAPLGVVHVRAGLGFGISERMLRRRAGTDGWPPLYPLTYAAPGASPEDPFVRLAAALVSLGYPAFAARESALWLHGVIPEEDAPRRPQILLPHDRRYRPGLRHALDVSRSRHLPVGHLVDARGLGSATVARAIVDLAERGASRSRLRALAIRARRLGCTDIAERLATCAGAFGLGRDGLGTIMAVIADLTRDGADSSPEFGWRRILRAAGYAVWPAPFPWRCDDGVIVHTDLAIPSAWVTVEHEGPDHLRPEVFRRDVIREAQVRRHWQVVRATDEDRERPERVLREVRYHVDRADPSRPPAVPAPCGCDVCRRVPQPDRPA